MPIRLNLTEQNLIILLQVFRRAIQQKRQHPGSLDMPQKLETQSSSDVRAFDDPRNIRSDYLFVFTHIPPVSDTQKVFDIFNLCSGNPVKLKNLLLEIARIMNVDDKLLDFGKKQMRIGEPLRSYGSSKKAEMQLNWKSNPINEDLRKYILNYKKANI